MWTDGLRTGTWPFSHDDWFTLPLKLRQRWWSETNYSRTQPSEKLLDAVKDALNKKAVKSEAGDDNLRRLLPQIPFA